MTQNEYIACRADLQQCCRRALPSHFVVVKVDPLLEPHQLEVARTQLVPVCSVVDALEKLRTHICISFLCRPHHLLLVQGSRYRLLLRLGPLTRTRSVILLLLR